MKKNIALLTLLMLSFKLQACLILYMNDGINTLVGNHEDWFAKDAAVRIIPATNGNYGSVIFTFASEGWAQGGMNERGLFFDGTFTPYQSLDKIDGIQPYQGYIWQEVLNKCASVEEALAMLVKYRLTDLEQAHIMLADATGRSALIGLEKGKVVIKDIKEGFHLQTNFNPWQPELSDEPVCKRYKEASVRLTHDASVSQSHMLSILKATHQEELTVYSNIYDLRNKQIVVYNKRQFDRPLLIDLQTIFKKGACMMSLDALVADGLANVNCLEKPKGMTILSGQVTNDEGRPVSFANIGIEGTVFGTISDMDGTFVLRVDPKYHDDSVTFSSIGFVPKKLSVQEVVNTSSIRLTATVTVLDEVMVEAKKNQKRSRLGHMGGKDGVLPFDTLQGGGAVAVLMEAPSSSLYIEKVMVRLLYNSKDTLALRLHFYEYDEKNNQPGAELLQKEIILTEQRKFGWLRFDLRQEEIFINENRFLVGFEWLDERQTREKLWLALSDWQKWKKREYINGNPKMELMTVSNSKGDPKQYIKYHGNMMNWPGWDTMPPFTGLMIETGKTEKTTQFRTIERKTSFSEWVEKPVTLNAVVVVSY